ncbi:RsfS/YbeB/iojap family protein, partial [Enterococcus faecium]
MDSNEQLKIAIEAADSKRAEDIIALDVRNVSLLADYFMICSA